MKALKTLVLTGLIISTISGSDLYGQKEKTITIKKEQGFDVLIATRKPGTDELLNTYFNKVFPMAGRHNYSVQGSFVTVAPPTKGNFHPGFVSLGSWASPDNRDNFRKDSKNLDYDYVAERRKIWSVFNLTEYDDLANDISFTASTDKVYVYTAYWVEDMEAFRKAKSNAGENMRKAGGKLIVALGKGHSPNGYLYEPDILSLTEWESEEAFRKYNESIDFSKNDAGARNVNQWITRFLAN